MSDATMGHAPIKDKIGDTSHVGRGLDDMPQPFAGAIVLLETIAECGARPYIGGDPTPMRETCMRFASELRTAGEAARLAGAANAQQIGLLQLALEQTRARLAQADARIEELEASHPQVAGRATPAATPAGAELPPTVPTGYAWLPLEPSTEMTQAANDLPEPRMFAKVWRAMTAVALRAVGAGGQVSPAMGYAWLPLEPTEVMVHAAEDVPGPRDFAAVWRAMMAVAPLTVAPAPESSLNEQRYVGWRDAVLTDDRDFVCAIQNGLPSDVLEYEDERAPTAKEWDAAIDHAIAAKRYQAAAAAPLKGQST